MQVKMEAMESRAESADDMAAAEMAAVSDDGDDGRGEVAQDHGQDRDCLATFQRRRRAVRSEVPV